MKASGDETLIRSVLAYGWSDRPSVHDLRAAESALDRLVAELARREAACVSAWSYRDASEARVVAAERERDARPSEGVQAIQRAARREWEARALAAERERKIAEQEAFKVAEELAEAHRDLRAAKARNRV